MEYRHSTMKEKASGEYQEYFCALRGNRRNPQWNIGTPPATGEGHRGYQKSPADMREFSTVMVSQGGDSIPANEA